MASATSPSFENMMMNAIRTHIQTRAEEVWEEERGDLIAKFDLKKHEAVAGIVLNIMKTVQMERLGENLQITIRETKIP